MASQSYEIEQVRDDHAAAMEKARMWAARAVAAREQGRSADASRCEDKARDWASRARQLERQRQTDKA
jgi:hypothetical protein